MIEEYNAGMLLAGPSLMYADLIGKSAHQAQAASLILQCANNAKREDQVRALDYHRLTTSPDLCLQLELIQSNPLETRQGVEQLTQLIDRMHSYWFKAVHTNRANTAATQLYASIQQHAHALHPFLVQRAEMMAGEMVDFSFSETISKLTDLLENFLGINRDDMAQVLNHQGNLDE
jgi:hypothetical protein